MKNLKIFLALVALSLTASLAFAADSAVAPTAAKPAAEAHPYTGKLAPKLNRAEVDKLLGNPDKIIFIDLRRPDEIIAIGSFPIYLSIQAKNLKESLDYIPKDRQIVTVSNHAGRAAGAADLLVTNGFHVVGAVGVQDYEAEGGTLSKITPPVPKATKGADAGNPAEATKTADASKK